MTLNYIKTNIEVSSAKIVAFQLVLAKNGYRRLSFSCSKYLICSKLSLSQILIINQNYYNNNISIQISLN